MASEKFAESLKRVLVHEGGYSNDPVDPGGVTLNGVIQRVYNADRKRRGLPLQPLTRAMLGTASWISERDTIYRRQYWDAVKGDQLPAGVDYCVFDGAVNSGPVQSIKWLQRALAQMNLYRGAIDGHMGESTLEAIEACNDNDRLVAAICDRRMAFLRALSTFYRFGRGWTERVSNVRKVGQAWATGSVGPQPVFLAGMENKARIEDAKRPPSAAAGDLASGGGVVSGSLGGGAQALQSQSGTDIGATLQQTQDALTPLSYTSAIVGHIVIGLIVIGAVLTVGGLAYRFYANWKRAKVMDALDFTPSVSAS